MKSILLKSAFSVLSLLTATEAYPSTENCKNGLCDIFRITLSAKKNISVLTPSTPRNDMTGNPSRDLDASPLSGSDALACSKIVRVPEPVHNAIAVTLQHIAKRDYMARVQEFTPQEQTMLLFFHTIVQHARGLNSCGNR